MVEIGPEFGSVLYFPDLVPDFMLTKTGLTSSSESAWRKVFIVVLVVVNGSVLLCRTPTLATVSLQNSQRPKTKGSEADALPDTNKLDDNAPAERLLEPCGKLPAVLVIVFEELVSKRDLFGVVFGKKTDLRKCLSLQVSLSACSK